jgi:hypothetical protein
MLTALRVRRCPRSLSPLSVPAAADRLDQPRRHGRHRRLAVRGFALRCQQRLTAQSLRTLPRALTALLAVATQLRLRRGHQGGHARRAFHRGHEPGRRGHAGAHARRILLCCCNCGKLCQPFARSRVCPSASLLQVGGQRKIIGARALLLRPAVLPLTRIDLAATAVPPELAYGKLQIQEIPPVRGLRACARSTARMRGVGTGSERMRFNMCVRLPAHRTRRSRSTSSC